MLRLALASALVVGFAGAAKTRPATPIDFGLGGRGPSTTRSSSSPYWHLEKLYAAALKREGKLGAEVRRLRAEHRRRMVRTVRGTIRLVFAADAPAALEVAWCESRYDPEAVNGQYVGLFQMGSSERATYGDDRSVLGQVLAAYRYFLRAGGWAPWSCRP